jgi:DNA polymerase I-like protein with 3'-5' exonuclease and polymerase domains
MFFDDVSLVKRKHAQLKALPPVPETGWRSPREFPNLESATTLSFDVETYDPDLTIAGPGWARGRGHIVGISLGAEDRLGNTGAWYFPIRHTVEPEYNLDATQVLRYAKYVLETRIPKVGANLLYDVGWLAEENIYVAGDLQDVQFAEALLDGEARVALDVLGWKYLRESKTTNLLYDWITRAYAPPISETRASIYRSPPRLVGPYAESDAALPLRILRAQRQQLTNEQLTELFKLECDLIPLLVRMRRDGVSVDVEKAIRLKEQLEHETKQLYSNLAHTYGIGINSCSTANLTNLFNHIGIEFPQTPTGKGKFEKEWLKGLQHPVGALVNDIREHEKICGTFLQSYIIEKNINGKLYPQFHPLKGDANGTQVGRFASSDPNLQNIPSRTKLGKMVREAFVPDAGHACWRKLDYSQIHYRELAHFAIDGDIDRNDFGRIEAFWSDPDASWGSLGSADSLRARYRNDPRTDYHDDVYNNVAPRFGWDITDKALRSEKRRPIKNINFGLLYGQSEKSLAYKSGLSGAQATEFFKFYHEGAPYVRTTMKAIGYEVQQYGYVRTILGRRIRFNLWEPSGFGDRGFPLHYDEAIRQYGPNIRRAYEYRGVNYKLQGSEPDIMKTGMRACLQSGVFDYTGVPRLTVHDELDFSVKDDTKGMREAFAFIQYTMANAVKLKVPVYIDMKSGPNWGKAD